MRAFLRRISRDAALADDIAQDAFLIAYERIDEFTGQGAFGAWLYRIAYRRFLEHRRSRDRRQRREDLCEPPDADPLPSGSRIDLDRALERLSENERVVVLLCYGSGLSHAEAAQVLALPIGTVKSHASRGREKMATFLTRSETDHDGR